MMAEEDVDDCWGAFGSDDDDDSDDGIVDDKNKNGVSSSSSSCSGNQSSAAFLAAASDVTLVFAKTFLHINSKVPIAQRRIALQQGEENNNNVYKILKETLNQRGFTNLSDLSATAPAAEDDKECWWDAIILGGGASETCTTVSQTSIDLEAIHKNLIPGGLLLLFSLEANPERALEYLRKEDPTKWESDPKSTDQCAEAVGVERIFTNDHLQVLSIQKTLFQVQEKSCPWLPSSHSVAEERHRLKQATVPLAAQEIRSGRLLEPSLIKAVQRMQDCGYCILPRILPTAQCLEWGEAVLADLHAASQILLQKDGVNILNPHDVTCEGKDPQSYRELSMREDLRMDLRDGPRLRRLRGGGQNNNKPIVLRGNNNNINTPNGGGTNNDDNNNDSEFFRLHPSILEVVRRTMNPKSGTLYKGNFGRYNFSGSGPDGSYQDMRLSAIGGIVSLPGSADQALHADTPHLFEIQTLPAHYINAFTLACHGSGGNQNPLVGCTAFVHGSHRIEFTAQYLAEEDDDNYNNSTNDNNKKKVFEFLVRPQLELGDVLLFDCRILHFGLANMSKDVERPLLYCNMTHAWFTDPKNWDDHRPIFVD